MTERPGPWRRDAGWTDRCACGHLSTSHRHDLARSSPCASGGCDCRLMRPAVRLFREHRWVEVPLDVDTPTV